MKLDELAKRLSDPERIGLTEALVKQLGIVSEDVTRGRLMAQIEADRSHFGVYVLAVYVIDDTDFWGDGEVYWWTIPTIVDADGNVSRSALHGLPQGGEPHKVGSLEWMTNFSLASPPLIAVIPPEERAKECIIRIGFYDDDGKPANLAGAITAGLEALATCSTQPLQGANQILAPVRDAIWKSLKAEQDDILVDQDLTIRRGESILFSNGMIGAIVNNMIRVYYFVRDEAKTEQFGPIALHKGQVETVRFPSAIKAGGRVAVFTRGADVNCSAFGDLTTDVPFLNRVIDTYTEPGFANGFNVSATGASKLVAFYTPPA